MKVAAPKGQTIQVNTTWGVGFLLTDVPREVRPPLGKLALERGAILVTGDAPPSLAPDIDTAVARLIKLGDPNHFTSTGLLRTSAVAVELGRDVTRAETDEAVGRVTASE